MVIAIGVNFRLLRVLKRLERNNRLEVKKAIFIVKVPSHVILNSLGNVAKVKITPLDGLKSIIS